MLKSKIAYICMVIIFCLFQIFISQNKIITDFNQNIMNQEFNTENKIENEEKTERWEIEIPKISLKATIAEGTTKETLNQYVGHFEQTQKEEGNIGLAAHNRGYEVNYFQNLKLLQKGDEIKYIHNQFEKIYEVEKCRIIKDTEWEYLENTEDNRLTLITCIKNKVNQRLCVQAVQENI